MVLYSLLEATIRNTVKRASRFLLTFFFSLVFFLFFFQFWSSTRKYVSAVLTCFSAQQTWSWNRVLLTGFNMRKFCNIIYSWCKTFWWMSEGNYCDRLVRYCWAYYLSKMLAPQTNTSFGTKAFQASTLIVKVYHLMSRVSLYACEKSGRGRILQNCILFPEANFK